jgi:hypothetical protein
MMLIGLDPSSDGSIGFAAGTEEGSTGPLVTLDKVGPEVKSSAGPLVTLDKVGEVKSSAGPLVTLDKVVD